MLKNLSHLFFGNSMKSTVPYLLEMGQGHLGNENKTNGIA